MCVRVPVVLDENFIGARDLIKQDCEIARMPVPTSCKARIKVRVRSVLVGHVIGPLGPHRDLDTLDSIKKKETEFPIKDVKCQGILERSARAKKMRLPINLERQPVGPKAVIVDVLEIVPGRARIVDPHAPVTQEGDLFVAGRGGLAEIHVQPPERSNPPV